ncbi:MAG: hypothetical protein OXI33_13885 [Chloroflexota bacterium]|nr:hypothetical protein [Chloroflexota bacterium]
MFGPAAGRITLDWRRHESAEGYELQQSFGNNAPTEEGWRDLSATEAHVNLTEAKAVIRGLLDSATYWHRVRSEDEEGNKSDWSSPIKTTMPNCTTIIPNILDYNSSSTHHRQIINGNWDSDCYGSYAPPGSDYVGTDDRPYAQFYQFTVRPTARVYIDLESDIADAYIVLRNGIGKDGDIKVENDDNNLQPLDDVRPSNSRVDVSRLSAKTYTVEVTMTDSTPVTGSFTLTLHAELAKQFPELGHQEDYVSKYTVGDISLPSDYEHDPRGPDPDDVIGPSIPIAATVWNNAVSKNWPKVHVCKENTGTCNDKNTDDKKTTITIVGTCTGLACIDAGRNVDSDGHMGNMTMIIEEPSYSADGVRILWTLKYLNSDVIPPALGESGRGAGFKYVGEDEDGNDVYLAYLPGVIMHEFGHSLGLTDLDQYPEAQGWLMDYGQLFKLIPTTDRAYLRQVYRNEHGWEPHRR